MRKLLVWDGDESLWKGTITSGDTPELPESRLKLCSELFDRGVVQSVASRNLLRDVEQTLHLLGLSNFFLSVQADFNRPKSEMITTIMQELNITKYSDLVFVDDDMYQRSEVGNNLPGVLVVDPGSISKVVAKYFTKPEYTEEDRLRVSMYRSEQLRRTTGEAYKGDKLEFLKSCEMKATIGLAAKSDMRRIKDLVARANQLSASLGKPTNELLDKFCDDKTLWTLKAEDKFGTYGLSGVINISPARIITLLTISCRLQGKGYGSALVGYTINRFLGKSLGAVWKETEYNAGVKSLYDWYGFKISTDDDNVVIATKQVEQSVELPDWIRVTG